MINHLTGHSAIDTDVFARDETSLIGAKVKNHVGNIQRIAHTTSWLLHSIGTFINSVGGVYPSRRDRVDTDLAKAWVNAAIPPFAAV